MGALLVELLGEGAAGSSNFGFQFGFASNPTGAFSGKKFIGGGSTGGGIKPLLDLAPGKGFAGIDRLVGYCGF